VNGLSRLRRARVSKARNQRRIGIPNGVDRSDPLTRVSSVAKSLSMTAVRAWSILTSVTLSAIGTLLFVGLLYLLYQAVTSSAIEVAPVSVPKDLAENGYTSEAVTLQLREALLDLVKQARTAKRTVNVVSQKDEPTIDLPQTGMSLDTIAAEIRERFGLGDWWKVSSSIESADGKIRLNVCLEGASGHNGIPPISKNSNQIDELFSSAAQSIFEIIDPYIVAASYANKDQKTAIELARKIILASSKDNSSAAWAHVLMSYINLNRGNLSEAKKEAKTAIKLDNSIVAAH
jgi:hypothetical protein